jgi:hypothetical protein
VNQAELERQRPTDGARYLLELDTSTEAGARYRAWILTPTTMFAYTAELAAGAEPVLAAAGDAAPTELADRLAMFAKLLARSAPPWPHRVLRWRRDNQSSSSV